MALTEGQINENERFRVAMEKMFQRRGYPKRTDEEYDRLWKKTAYFTKEEAMERIEDLKKGPEIYMVESNTMVPGICTRKEMIENVKARIRP